jgi:hypothetical protein
MVLTFSHLLNFMAPGLSLHARQSHWAAGRRAAGFVFCSPFIKFIMTRNFAASTRTHTQAGFTLTRDFAAIYQDWQKTRQPRPGRPLIKPAAVRVNDHTFCILDSFQSNNPNLKAKYIY